MVVTTTRDPKFEDLTAMTYSTTTKTVTHVTTCLVMKITFR